MIHLNLGTATRWGLNGLLLLALFVALYLGRVVFIPIVISLLLAAMLWPAVQWLNAGCACRWSVACAVMVGLLAGHSGRRRRGRLASAVPKVVQQLPTDEETAQQTYGKFRTRLVNVSPWPLNQEYLPEKASESKAVQYLRKPLDPQKSRSSSTPSATSARRACTWLWQSVLIMFILFFLLLEGRMLTRRLVEIFGPSAEAQGKVVAALAGHGRPDPRLPGLADDHQLRAWRLIFGLVYHLMGLSQPWTWALLTAVLCYVPYLGPIMAGIPPMLDAFVTCESPWMARRGCWSSTRCSSRSRATSSCRWSWAAAWR